MTIALTATFFLGLASLVLCGALPDLEVVPCEKPFLKGHVECLKVTFDGGNVEYAGLDYFKKEFTKEALSGILYTTDGEAIAYSAVSFTKHVGYAEVTISDPNDEELYQLKLDFETGEVTPLTGPVDGNTKLDDPLVPPENEGEQSDEGSSEMERQQPPSAVNMTLQMLYDPSFAAKFGNNRSRINAAIVKILDHTQTFFLHSSLRTKIVLNVKPFIAIGQRLTATGTNLRRLVSIAARLPDADSYSLLTYENNAGGTIGIAWLRSTCSTSRGYRTNINEYFSSDVRTAAIIVHEIGHNLGMNHDFVGRPGNMRRASNGASCTGIRAFMDYVGNPYQWSPCSNEDFNRYYRSIFQRYRRFCLPTATTGSPDGPTTSPPTTTTTTTTNRPQPDCKDNFSYCSQFRGYCRRYGSIYYFMQMACMQTCGFCENGKLKCFDQRNSSTCNYVKRRGLCNGNSFWPTYGRTVCRKTCQLC